MAVIQFHPEVADYVHHLTLDEIAARPDGVADLFEDGALIIVKDYRLAFDFGAMLALSGDISAVEEDRIRRKLKKLVATTFFEGDPPERITRTDGTPTLKFRDRVRQAVFDHLAHGDAAIFERASAALLSAHQELQRIFGIAFPHYRPTRLLPSIRLTETLFENLHWDNHAIDDDFQQARIFANIDTHKRIWSIGDHFLTAAEKLYDAHDLGRFAGRDPNHLISYITGDVMGGTRAHWKDTMPRHRVAFEPGEVWIGESRLISHQITYGERAMVYMWFVDPASMSDPTRRFNARIEALHERMAARAGA